MNDVQKKAKSRGLQDLMGAMDDDQMEPLLHLKIRNGRDGGGPEIHDDGLDESGSKETPEGDAFALRASELGSEGESDEDNSGGGTGPWESFLKRKMAEKGR